MLLVKGSLPLPLLTLLLVTVGFGFLLQQIPFSKISLPPLLEMVPPLMTEFAVILFALFVIKIGIVCGISFLHPMIISNNKSGKEYLLIIIYFIIWN